MIDKRPRCPRCGEPARVVIVRTGWLRFQLLEDGALGSLITGSGKRTSMETYECGGRHEWGGAGAGENP